MVLRAALLGAALMIACGASTALQANEEFKIPREVTPAIRAACESDVRRLCIGLNPSIAKVKSCVAAKFSQLAQKCQVELASAGFAPQ
jgi:hypothetical protein